MELHIKARKGHVRKCFEFFLNNLPVTAGVILNMLMLQHLHWGFGESILESICMGFVIAELLTRRD